MLLQTQKEEKVNTDQCQHKGEKLHALLSLFSGPTPIYQIPIKRHDYSDSQRNGVEVKKQEPEYLPLPKFEAHHELILLFFHYSPTKLQKYSYGIESHQNLNMF